MVFCYLSLAKHITPAMIKSIAGIICKKLVKNTTTPQTVITIPDTLVFELTKHANTMAHIALISPTAFVTIAVPARPFVTGINPEKNIVPIAINIAQIDPIKPNTNSGVLFMLSLSFPPNAYTLKCMYKF